jgi:predicted enzyme related to lactoylglutathione lyase
VTYYDDLYKTREFYEKAFGWDTVPIECDQNALRPTLLCATGPGFPNWEPRFGSTGYGFLMPRENDPTGRQPRFMVEVDSIEDVLKKVGAYGGEVIRGAYVEDGKLYAVLADTEGNPFYVWQTPDDVTFREPESQVYYKWDRKNPYKYDRMYKSDFDPKSRYPYRAPKKFTRKSLHGRPRFGSIYYHAGNFRAFQKFWVDLFGWDFFELPAAVGGKEPGDPNPGCLIATGPSYETWEGCVPGHMNMGCYPCEDETLPEVGFGMEIHMDVPIAMTAAEVENFFGKVGDDVPKFDNANWFATFTAWDPSGNKLSLSKCPDSRTWDEAEAGWDTWDPNLFKSGI